MNDTSPRDARPPQMTEGRGRLDSWKKIAGHFNRDVTTVQRWERREGMPVHRHVHDKQGSVYAFRSELDAWWEGRRGKLADSIAGLPEEPALSQERSDPAPLTASLEPEPAVTPDRLAAGFIHSYKRPIAIAAIVVVVLLLVYGTFRLSSATRETWHSPLANATFTRLTDWPGSEQAAEISPDGRWVSFLADHDGHMDAWLTQIGSGSFRNLTHGKFMELVNPAIRTLGFTADGAVATIWTRSSDGSHAEDIKLLAAPTAGGDLYDLLPGVAEAAWSHDGKEIVYHTTAPGDPLFVRNAQGMSRQIYVAPTGMHCHFPVWSKDDTHIYFTRGTPPDDWDIWRIGVSGEGLERMTFHHSRVSHPVMLDQHTLAYLASDSQGAGPWMYALNLEQRVPHRMSFGLERYGSLAASVSGTRLVATVEESESSVWSAPLDAGAGGGGQGAAQPASLVLGAGFSPRAGPDYLLYASVRAGRQGIWKAKDGQSLELWSDVHATIVGAPSVTRDGLRIAFTVADGENTALYVMDSEGKGVREVTRTLQLRGDPAWAPDGKSIVSAALRDGEPRLMSIFLDGSPPTQLVTEYSIDPVWSPDGEYLIYSGADVGTTFILRAAARDGRPYAIPTLMLTRGARRIAFCPDGTCIVLLKGEMGHKSFRLVDLHTGVERQIVELAPDIAIRDFDVARDGRSIVFDRTRQSSRIALIER